MPNLVIETKPLIRVHVLLDQGDWKTWQALFSPNIGTSRALGKIIRDYLRKLERAAEDKQRAAMADASAPLDPGECAGPTPAAWRDGGIGLGTGAPSPPHGPRAADCFTDGQSFRHGAYSWPGD